MPRRNNKCLMSRTLIAALAMCFVFAQAACSSAPSAQETTKSNGDSDKSIDRMSVNFDNGNLGFMRSYEASPDATRISLSIAGTDHDGLSGNGALIKPDNDGTMYIAVDLSSLLGEHVSDLRALEADIEVVNDYPDFYAISGEAAAIDAGGNTAADSVWSVYLAEKNPNTMRLELTNTLPSGKYNMLILSKTVDNATTAGLMQSSLLISELRFFDSEGQLLPVNSDASFDAPDGFGEPDRSNLATVSAEAAVEGARGSSSGWGQAVALLTEKNGGPFDAKTLHSSIVTVYYSSDSPPELILQSWTDGSPESAGWAKVAPSNVNDSGNIAQYSFEDMVSSFGTDDFETYLDQLYVGDTGAELRVFSVTTGIGG